MQTLHNNNSFFGIHNVLVEVHWIEKLRDKLRWNTHYIFANQIGNLHAQIKKSIFKLSVSLALFQVNVH
jgi:O-acetylhomoserine/O-acetylserine sulfhydrylase-like pyridoxal-dependent enzyme